MIISDLEAFMHWLRKNMMESCDGYTFQMILDYLKPFDYLMVQFLSISFIKKLIVKSDTCIHRHHSCQSEMKLNQNCPSSWLERGQASKEIDASWWVTSKILSMKSVLIKFWDKNDPGTLSFQCPLVTSKFGSPAFLGGTAKGMNFLTWVAWTI